MPTTTNPRELYADWEKHFMECRHCTVIYPCPDGTHLKERFELAVKLREEAVTATATTTPWTRKIHIRR